MIQKPKPFNALFLGIMRAYPAVEYMWGNYVYEHREEKLDQCKYDFLVLLAEEIKKENEL